MLKRSVLAIVLVILSGFAAPSVLRADPQEPRLANNTARELWRKGSDQILAGDFKSAIATLQRVNELEPGQPQVASVLTWMEQADQLDASRERLRQKTYEYYVNKAQEAAKNAREAKPSSEVKKVASDEEDEDEELAAAKKEKGDKKEDKKKEEEKKDKGYYWSQALRHANSALLYAKDEDEFRKEPWLDEIVQGTKGEIERHKRLLEWADALALYAYLQGLYPKDKQFEEGYTFCGKRAHLDFVYGPKSKGRWRTDLRDVTGSVIPQILERIDDDYVEEADFKKLCIDGLEHLLLLAQAESISKTFPTLGDKDLVTHFVTRLNGLKKSRVQTRAKLTAKQVDEVFRRVLAANSESLRLPESVLVDEFVAGMSEPLDDFTSVIWPADVDEFNKHTRGEFVGVGIQITQDIGEHIRVESPLEDSPAYRAGIKPGDLIIAVDGKSTLEMNINQAVSEITGEPGTKVTLTMKDGVTGKTSDYTLVREQIILRTVRGHLRDPKKTTGWDYIIDPATKIAYVRVGGFMDKTVKDLEAALDQIEEEGCRGLILDLRFNPGGLLTAAVKMCELFIGNEEPIVRTKGRSRQQNMEITSRGDRKYGNMPLIILVNEYSASASEIVAGAVSGLKEACIVGTRTFGKGSVQNLIPIADNHAYLKLTTAYYYVPDPDVAGDPWYLLHRKDDAKSWGVEPHVIVKVMPIEMTKILRLRRERDLLKGRDQGEIPKEVLERRATSEPAEPLPEDENPNVDPQIETALNIMRIKLMSNQPWAMPPREMRALSRSDATVKEPVNR